MPHQRQQEQGGRILNPRKPALLALAALAFFTFPLMAQNPSSANGGEESQTTVNFSLAPNNPDKQVKIINLLGTGMLFAPGVATFEEGGYELEAIGGGSFLPATVTFDIQASGGIQNWEISTKPKLTHDIVFWGGIGVATIGVILGFIYIGQNNDPNQITPVDATPAYVLMGGGVVAMLVGLLLPEATATKLP